MSDATTVGMELSRFKAFSSADREPIVAHGDASLAGWPAEGSKFEGQGKPLDAQKAMKWRCSLLRLLTYLSKIATVKSIFAQSFDQEIFFKVSTTNMKGI